MKDKDILLGRYTDAQEIYILQRSKIMSKSEKALDWAVCLFTPLAGIVDMADAVADMGAYYLVVKQDSQLLVRLEKEELSEKDITGIGCEKKFTVDGNRFRKVRKIYGEAV